jgi:integrase
MHEINGKGTIQSRGKNTWRIRHSLGRDPLNGKYRCSPWRTVHGSKPDARRALEDYRRELESGLRYDLKAITFAQYADALCTARENAGTLARGTLEGDRYHMRKLNNYLGHLRVSDIDNFVINEIIARMKNEDHLGGKLLHDLVVAIKRVMREAIWDGIILRDPCARIKTPKGPKPNRHSLKDYEAARLLEVLGRHPVDRNIIAVHIGLSTGMRKGEVLGLVWSDIDLQGSVIAVTHSLDRYKDHKAPKTEASKRRISIDGYLAERLSVWKAIQAETLLKKGIRQDGDTPVCSNGKGDFCEQKCFYRWFTNFCANNGYGCFVDENGNALPQQRTDADGVPVDENGRRYSRSNRKEKVKRYYRGLKFHELRHTHATILVANKVDIKTVQERMGHAKASTTLDFYAHADEERDRQASDLFSRVISPERHGRKIVNL